MSLFQFLASDKLLKEVKNLFVEVISINEALKRIKKVDDSVMNNKAIYKDEKYIIIL